MANASTTAATVINTAMVVTGAVTGTIVAGMTITGAGVPAGVTVVSGPGGIGTYVVTASSANVSIAEAMVFSLSGIPIITSNAAAPQLADYGLIAGYGLILGLGAAIPSTNTAFAQEYQYGTHAAAIHSAEGLKSRIFPSVKGGVPGDAVRSFVATPQAYDFTLPAQLSAPFVNQGTSFTQQYTYGTHAVALYNSQINAQIFPSARSSVVAQALRPIIVPPQAYDFTLQASFPDTPVASGWISTQIGAGPQQVDLTQQAMISPALIHLNVAPWNPRTILSVAQADPTQIPPQVFVPPLRIAPSAPLKSFFNAPIDPTQAPARVFQAVPSPPTKYTPPVVVQVPQQAYVDVPQGVVTPPLVGVFIPPPPPGFRVTAVTSGYYNGVYRTAGDVFDLIYAADFSDSSVDYQINSNGIGFGWMAKVPATTPLVNWLESNNAPYLPPQDPFRRFVY